MATTDDKKKKKWYRKSENYWIFGGFVIAAVAIGTPFFIVHHNNRTYDIKSFQDLGTIGDFFGGTTVGLLSLASIIFVTAAIIMQKEELELQREELEKTRGEYEATNTTMKKQQFDSTFFNMLNLQHNITKDIEIEGNSGRAAITEIHIKIKECYNQSIYIHYKEELINEALKGDKALLDDLVRQIFFNYHKEKYIQEFSDNYIDFDETDMPELSEVDLFVTAVNNGTHPSWLKEEAELVQFYETEVYMDETSYREWLELIDFRQDYKKIKSVYVDKFIQDFIIEPKRSLKVEAFQEVYNSYENQLGHYFRNLYRIVKLIQDEEFNSDWSKNEQEKKKYRGILRAQLSSYELLIIFYNLVYSQKGEKFKELLKDTRFFEDHLVASELIWKNDLGELQKLDVFKQKNKN